MCCFVFLQMNRILFAFEFHFLQLAPVSDICLFSSVQHALFLNVFLYSHPCYLTQRSFLFCRNTKENINNPSKWMLWLLMFYLLGGKWYFFFFQSRLSGVTTKRGKAKGTQQVVWAGARRQHKHMHTYIYRKVARTLSYAHKWMLTHIYTNTHGRSRCADSPSTGHPSPFSYVSWERPETHTLSLSHTELVWFSPPSTAPSWFICQAQQPRNASHIFREIREVQEASPPASQTDLFIITSKCTQLIYLISW